MHDVIMSESVSTGSVQDHAMESQNSEPVDCNEEKQEKGTSSAHDCTGPSDVSKEKKTSEVEPSKLQKGLRMLSEASDEDSVLLALKELRYFVSEPAAELLKNTNLFSIDVDENCTEYTHMLQQAINADAHMKVANVLKPYLNKTTLSFSQTQISLLNEGLWVLTNIASGRSPQTCTVVKTKILPMVTQLILKHENIELVTQCLMLISNIIADETTTQEIAITDQLLMRAFDLLAKVRIRKGEGCLDSKCSTCKASIESEVHILHLFTSIFKSNRSVSDEQFEKIILTCCAMLSDGVGEVQRELLEVLFKSSDGYANFIQTVINYGYVPDIVSLISDECKIVRNKAIYVVGNLMLGTDNLTWKILRSHLFIHLPYLLYSGKENVSQVLWILSNVVAGSCEMLDCLFDFDLWPYVAYCLRSTDGSVVYESIWVVANFMDNATKEQKAKVLCFDKYGVVSAILPHVSLQVLHLMRKEVQTYKNLVLVMEFLGMLLDFIDDFVDGNYATLKEELNGNHGLFVIFQHLKSDAFHSRFNEILADYPHDGKVSENELKLKEILGELEMSSTA